MHIYNTWFICYELLEFGQNASQWYCYPYAVRPVARSFCVSWATCIVSLMWCGQCCAAIYLMYFMALTTLSVAVSVLVLKVHHTSPSYEVPGWVRRYVLYMSSVMRMDVYNVIRRHSDAECSAPNNKIWNVCSQRQCGNVTANKRCQTTGVYAPSYTKNLYLSSTVL